MKNDQQLRKPRKKQKASKAKSARKAAVGQLALERARAALVECERLAIRLGPLWRIEFLDVINRGLR